MLNIREALDAQTREALDAQTGEPLEREALDAQYDMMLVFVGF